MRRGLLGLAFALTAAGGASSPALGAGFDFPGPVGPRAVAPGDLDTSFSGDGIEVTAPFGETGAAAVALQADGKFVVAGESGGDFMVARYNADGSLDTSFSGDGRQTTDFGGRPDAGTGVAVQPDGKIVVAGTARCQARSTGDFAIARYNPDGSLDTSFSGRRQADTEPASTISVPTARRSRFRPTARSWRRGERRRSTFAVARYNPTARSTTTFSGDGRLETQLGRLRTGTAVTIQPDGKLVVAGSKLVGPDGNFALARYNRDGSLDSRSRGDGRVEITDFGERPTASPWRSRATARSSTRGPAMAPTATSRWPAYNAERLARHLILRRRLMQTTNFGDRDYRNAAWQSSPTAGSWSIGERSRLRARPLQGRRHARQRVSDDGMVTTEFGGTSFEALDRAFDVAIQPDGRIVAAGISDRRNGAGDARHATRYTPDPTTPETTMSPARRDRRT